MKLALLSLMLVATHGFVHPSPSTTTTTTTVLQAATGATNKPAKYTTPIREKRLSGIGKKYKGADGSTILGPSFRLTLEIATMAPLIWFLHSDYFTAPVDQAGLLGAGFHVVLAAWIGLQANRVRAVFDDKAIEFYNLKGMGASYMAGPAKDVRLQKKPNNWLVNDTANRWNYKTIAGYRFYPSKEFPVVCILWEDETKAFYGKPYYGTQPHFFPTLFNAEQFIEEMEKHKVPYV